MDMLDDFEANALDDPLADLDRLLDLLTERYGDAGSEPAGAASAAAAERRTVQLANPGVD